MGWMGRGVGWGYMEGWVGVGVVEGIVGEMWRHGVQLGGGGALCAGEWEWELVWTYCGGIS